LPGSRPDLTVPQQYLFLRNSPLCVGTGTLMPTGLKWRFGVRPTSLSREYVVEIEYRRGDAPKVQVLSPSLLTLANGRKLPHVYRDPLRLCLWLPGSGEWDAHMRIDKTFVPWTSTWLFYFEEWLASDEWKGGGAHPQPGDDEGLSRRVRRMARRNLRSRE
jgi:hypothetical protein